MRKTCYYLFLDTAIPDMTPDGLINFDKRRKEFEVLAQVRISSPNISNEDCGI